jgi:hypothetical protein
MDHLLPSKCKRLGADKALSAGFGENGVKVAMPMDVVRIGGICDRSRF